ncbi:hypothetical protein [Costertonia aggregata]|uniref:Outer membrane beta-barrel protein n=1 Tax=Costertonia aggregata TaxID=343403 RepID=A0A7H9ANZ0_9FLAO|nr:hypothetical protein [Costertonia aggregata]QLG45114.1 hypothetical protein HYG79_07040 [Costertonia aggregata]
MQRKLSLIVLIYVLSLHSLYSQEDKFQFMLGYGMLYSEYTSTLSFSSPFENDYETPNIGPRLEFSLDYKISDTDYIGIGYAQHAATRRVTDQGFYESVQLVEGPDFINIVPVENGIPTLLSFQDFRLRREVRHYTVHFRRRFNKNLNLSVGLFIYQHFETFTFVSFNEFDQAIVASINDTGGVVDDGGAFAALDYMFPLKDYVSIGVRGQIFYSFIGVESLTFAPIVRFSF